MNLPTRTRGYTFGLWLAAACGDDGAATTTTQGPTGSPTDGHDPTSGAGVTETTSDATTGPAAPTTSTGDSTASESTAQPTTVDPPDDTTADSTTTDGTTDGTTDATTIEGTTDSTTGGTTTGVTVAESEQLGDGEFWSRRIGDHVTQYVSAVAATGDGFIVSGSAWGSLSLGEGVVAEGPDFFARFGLDGSPLWARDVDAWIKDVAVGPNGEVVVLMDMYGGVTLDGVYFDYAGSSDILLAKYGPDGAFLWGKVFGDPNYQTSEAVAVDPAGEILLVGDFDYQVDFGGGPLIEQTPHTGFIAHLDGDGAHIWSRAIGAGNGYNNITDVAAADAGFVIVGGCSGPVDFGDGPVASNWGHNGFVARYGPDHAVQWKHTYVTAGDLESADSVAIGGGAVYVAGHVDGQDVVDFGGGPLDSTDLNTYLIKLDETGAHVWSRLFGAAGCMQQVPCKSAPTNLAYSPGKGVIVSGWFEYAIDFGGGPLIVPSDGVLGFSAMFDESGAYGWSRLTGSGGAVGAADAGGEWLLGVTFDGDIDLGYGTHSSAGGEDIVLARLPWSG